MQFFRASRAVSSGYWPPSGISLQRARNTRRRCHGGGLSREVSPSCHQCPSLFKCFPGKMCGMRFCRTTFLRSSRIRAGCAPQLDGWQSGRMRSLGKRVGSKQPTRVRIPPHPPLPGFKRIQTLKPDIFAKRCGSKSEGCRRRSLMQSTNVLGYGITFVIDFF